MASGKHMTLAEAVGDTEEPMALTSGLGEGINL